MIAWESLDKISIILEHFHYVDLFDQLRRGSMATFSTSLFSPTWGPFTRYGSWNRAAPETHGRRRLCESQVQ